MAQLAERRVWDAEVAGSGPAIPTIRLGRCAGPEALERTRALASGSDNKEPGSGADSGTRLRADDKVALVTLRGETPVRFGIAAVQWAA